MNALIFKNTQFDVIDKNNQPWLRGLQIASALGYKNPASDISNLYDRNADEFTDTMTALVELDTEGGKQQVRIFSLRGCHLLGMLSKTKIAKEFRVWVLDVLDHNKDTGTAPIPIPIMPQPQNSVTLTLGENSKPKRYLVTQGESDLTVIRALPDDAYVGTSEQVIRDLHADGYIIIKKDSVSMQRMVMDYIPAQYLTDLIEAAASRLKRISKT